jgi:hypothetical protein
MKKAILAFLAGLIAWALVATLLFRGLRIAIDGYSAAELQMQFTLGMMLARLVCAFITSLAAGAVMGAVSPSSRRVPWIMGVLLMIVFAPAHWKLWSNFPIWYHAAFFFTLVPLLMLGARLTSAGRARTPAAEAVRPS